MATEWASHGFVVAAIEHRDKSAAVTIIKKKNGKQEILWYQRPKEVSKMNRDLFEWRHGQIQYRSAEIHETYSFLKKLNEGCLHESSSLLYPPSNQFPSLSKFDLSQLRNHLDMDQLVMAGHSFGAATAAHVLYENILPFRCGILMDTWAYPIKPQRITVPFLSLNSDTFHWPTNLDGIQLLFGSENESTDKEPSKRVYVTIKDTAHQDHVNNEFFFNSFKFHVLL